MQQENSVKVETGEDAINGLIDELDEKLGVIIVNFSQVVFVWICKNIAQSVKQLHLFFFHEFVLFLELVDLFLWACYFDLFIKQSLSHSVIFLFWYCCCCSTAGVTGCKWLWVLCDELTDLLNISSAKTLSYAKLFSSFNLIGSIVKWQLPHYTITEFNVKYMIILASWEHRITSPLFSGWHHSHSCTSALTCRRINYLTDELPLFFSSLPHISARNSVFFEHLDSITFTFILVRILDVWSICKLILLSGGSFCKQLLLILIHFWFKCFKLRIACEHPYLVILATNYEVTPGILRECKYSLWNHNGLFALACWSIPYLYLAVITTRC